MIIKVFLLALTSLLIHGLPLDKQAVDIETNENDPVITRMYAQEIEQGDNAELPLEGRQRHKKHHKANKKHIHGSLLGPIEGHVGHVPVGLPIHDVGLHGYGHDFGYGVPHIGPISHEIPHVGHHGHHGHHRPGYGPELPIIHLDDHHAHPHSHHHMAHFGYPEYMPLPYAMPMCVMEKKDDKKKDDKKKEKGKKSKRQLVPCHYYGPPGAGWGGFAPGWTGAGWGAPYWY